MTNRIVVTGAGGFVAGHVLQAMETRGDIVCAVVRSPSSAAGLGRFGIVPAIGDLSQRDFIGKLFTGFDTLVHCAHGPAIDAPDKFSALLNAARAGGVRRVIHMSTAEVYSRPAGDVTEDWPLVANGLAYGERKAAAERVLESTAAHFQSTVVLRPSIVYGPLSIDWSVRPIRRIVEGGWRPDSVAMNGICNPVFVSDLAGLVAELASGPLDGGHRIFNVVGPDRPTWNEYFRLIESGIRSRSEQLEPSSGPSKERGLLWQLYRLAGRSAFALPKSVRSSILQAAQSSRLLSGLAGNVRGAHVNWPAQAEIELYNRVASYSTARIDADGFSCRTRLQDGVERTISWARSMGLFGTLRPASSLLEATVP